MKRAVLLLVAACSGGGSKKETAHVDTTPPADAAPEIPAKLQAEVEAAITLITEIAAAAETVVPQTEDDCPAQAAAMRVVADGPNGKAILTLDEDPDFPPHAMAINLKYADRLDAASDRLADAVMICSFHPDMVSVLVDIGAIQAPPDPPPDE